MGGIDSVGVAYIYMFKRLWERVVVSGSIGEEFGSCRNLLRRHSSGLPPNHNLSRYNLRGGYISRFYTGMTSLLNSLHRRCNQGRVLYVCCIHYSKNWARVHTVMENHGKPWKMKILQKVMEKSWNFEFSQISSISFEKNMLIGYNSATQ